MKRFVWAMCALSLIAALAACQSTANGVSLQVTPDNPQILRVGSDIYTVADFSSRMERDIGPGVENLLAQGQTREQIEQLANDQQIRTSVFDSMVQEALLMQYARGQGIGVDAAAIDAAVLGQAAPFDPTSPLTGLTSQRIGQAQSQLALEVLARNTRADMFHARLIMLTSEAAADQALADLKGGADFATLATDRSGDTQTAADGGDIGWVPVGDLPAELNAAGVSQDLNTPAKVQLGETWYVFEVLERQVGDTADKKRPFDSFEQLQKSPNAQQFYMETFVPWYEQLLQSAKESGDMVIAEGFDPNSVPLPFPEQ